MPVRGAILLNEVMDQVLLVKGWKKGSSWGFPRGKINKNERDLDCAIREVYEETGFNLREAGLVNGNSETSYLETTLREQNVRLFIFRGVSTDIEFAPRTRKEISVRTSNFLGRYLVVTSTLRKSNGIRSPICLAPGISDRSSKIAGGRSWSE